MDVRGWSVRASSYLDGGFPHIVLVVAENAKQRFQLAGIFDEYLGACVEVIMIRALQGHSFDWIEPLRLHRSLELKDIERF